MENIVLVICLVSLISVLSSTFVILTPVLFRNMRHKLFMHLIAYISIGDLLGNIPYVVPARPTKGGWCDLQGLLNFGGYPIEWWWTAVLVYLLYHLAVYGRMPAHMWLMHLVSWGIPISTTGINWILGPFEPTDMPGEVCLAATPNAIMFHESVYYAQFFLVILLMFILYVRIQRMEKESSGYVTVTAFKVAKEALVWYPSLLFIFWFPHFVSSFIPNNIRIDRIYQAFLLWKICHGIAISIIFFYQSPESRKLWFHLLFSRCWSETYRLRQESVDVESIAQANNSVENILNSVLVQNLAIQSNLLLGQSAAVGYNGTHSHNHSSYNIHSQSVTQSQSHFFDPVTSFFSIPDYHTNDNRSLHHQKSSLHTNSLVNDNNGTMNESFVYDNSFGSSNIDNNPSSLQRASFLNGTTNRNSSSVIKMTDQQQRLSEHRQNNSNNPINSALWQEDEPVL